MINIYKSWPNRNNLMANKEHLRILKQGMAA